VTNIRQWLESLGLGQYANAFEENAIEPDLLGDLSDDDLRTLGVEALGHRKRILKALTEPGVAGSTSAPVPRAVTAENPAPAREAERRQLTVMFCDLVGSTELSQRLDPEELRDVMGAFQDRCAGAIARFGGFIARYMGDGLLVYFGFPQTHEDEPERAVRAGLDIVASVGALNLDSGSGSGMDVRLSVRIGIATGMVVVGDIVGEGAAAESAVVGETPNLAARLQGLAEPDQVIVSATTRELVAQRFEIEDLGRHSLKGLAEPVEAWRIVGDRGVEPVGQSRRGAQGVPLVGRVEELGLLQRAWEASKAGHGQVVLINGEPGIGKSRLLQGLREQLDDATYLWVPIHCSPYHAQSALHPVIEQLKRAFRWDAGDTADTRLEKLEQTLSGSSFELQEVVPLYATLLSLPLPAGRYPPVRLEPRQQRQMTLDAISGWLFEEAERRPAVQVWEDLHWADPSTLELLELYIEQAPTAPMLSVVTFRPEFTPPWPQRSHMTPITLNRFEGPEAESLISHLGGGKSFPIEVVEHIVGKADGVPLYVEELTKSIRESELITEQADRFVLTGALSDTQIPATLQDTLMSRLDRLPAVRELAQLGAVLGREFDYEMLRDLAGVDEATLRDGLRQLVAAELLYQRGRPPRSRYIFKHALIQDAAYQSLLRRTRQQHHHRVATLLEERFPEIVHANPDLVAHHFTEAGDIERALDYWQMAGDRALGQSANHEAIGHLSTGLSLLERMPADHARHQREINLQVALGDANQTAKGMGNADVGSAYRRALDLCRMLGDTERLYPVQFGLWRFHAVQPEFDAALALASDLLHQAEREEEVVPQVFADYALGFTHLLRGELSTASTHLDRSLRNYEPSQRRSPLFGSGQDPSEACGVYRAWLLWLQGFPDQALDQCKKSLAYAESLGHPVTLAHAQTFAAIVHQLCGETAEVLHLAERNVTLTTEHGMGQWRGISRVLRGWAMQRLGRREGAVAEILGGIDGWRESGARALVPHLTFLLADALMQEGRRDEALAATDEALHIVDETGERVSEAELHRLRGSQLAERDEAASVAALRTALDVAEAQGARGWELRAATSLAQALKRQGMGERARELLVPRLNYFTQGLDTADLVEARATLDGIPFAAGGTQAR
jgi:class 3 adenylate cyclase/predicted ATPase